MSSQGKRQVPPRLLQAIAMLCLVGFAAVMAYAVRATSETVADINSQQQEQLESVQVKPQTPSS